MRSLLDTEGKKSGAIGVGGNNRRPRRSTMPYEAPPSEPSDDAESRSRTEHDSADDVQAHRHEHKPAERHEHWELISG
jgi:hypothetical protein